MRVIVNPNYRSEGWYDPKSGMTFRKSDGEITIPEDINVFNIMRYIKLNYLLVVEDEETGKVEKVQQLVTKTPAELLAQEPKVEELKVEKPEAEEVEELVVEEPEGEEPETLEDANVCKYCGKELKSSAGRAAHERSCKENPDN